MRNNKFCASNHTHGFTIIELMIAMALIAIAIVIFIQASGMFNDRLLALQKKTETKTSLMRLTLYLDSLQDVMDVAVRCSTSTPAELSCMFYSGPGGTLRSVSIFPLAQHGFISAEWRTSMENNVTRHYLLLNDAKFRKTRIYYGLFPGIAIEH